MRDVQMDVLKKLMAEMGGKSLGRLPKKTGSAVLEISLRDGEHGDESESAEELAEADDGQDGDFEEEGLDPRLAAIMKKKKSGAPC